MAGQKQRSSGGTSKIGRNRRRYAVKGPQKRHKTSGTNKTTPRLPVVSSEPQGSGMGRLRHGATIRIVVNA
jgi:hypothetical protein